MRAAAGVQAQIDQVVKGLHTAEDALSGFASALRTAQRDIQHYAASHTRELNAYQSKHRPPGTHSHQTKPHNGLVLEPLLVDPSAFSSDWGADADAARKRLHRAAQHACSRLDDAIASIVPGGRHASATDLRHRVATTLGISLTGTATGGDIDRALDEAAGHLPPVPKRSEPEHVSQWWKGLSSTERDALIKYDSSAVGNLNGVPCATRDKANRISLTNYIEYSKLNPWASHVEDAKKLLAAITWWGYDAPPGLPQSADRTRADAGAPALDAFQTGLRITHHGKKSLNTVVGHSYGSVLVGDAASHGRTLDADQIIFLGSPGVTVDHVWDLHLTGVPADQTSKHVFDSRAKNDIIQLVPPVKKYGWAGSLAAFTLLPPGINELAREYLGYKDAKAQSLGSDPWDPKFGDQRFASYPGKAAPDPVLPYALPLKFIFPGMPLPPKTIPTVDAHVGYWSDGNWSLRNMGSIIAGKGVTYAP